MSKQVFKEDEIVLVDGMPNQYELAWYAYPVATGHQIKRGHYTTLYRDEAVHKCPKSILNQRKRLQEQHR